MFFFCGFFGFWVWFSFVQEVRRRKQRTVTSVELPCGPGDGEGICDKIWDRSLRSETVASCITDQFVREGNENEAGTKV